MLEALVKSTPDQRVAKTVPPLTVSEPLKLFPPANSSVPLPTFTKDPPCDRTPL